MKLAFSKPTSGDVERRELFSAYGTAGYDGLQLKNAQYREYVGAPERFKEAWRTYPGIASGLITGGQLDDDGIAALRELIAFGRAVGSERIIFCHSLSRKGISADQLRSFAATLSELGKESRQAGVRLSLHHHYDQPVMYRDDFDVFFDAVDDQAVGLTIDTAHLVKSGIGDIAEVITAFGDLIDNFHVKDFTDGEFRVLGQGEIDFEPVFAAIRSIEYQGWLCADEESGSDLSGTLDACHRFMTASLDEA